MNKRIRELAEQAGFYYYDMHNVDGQDLGETVEADSWRVPEVFAKLIVRECCQKLENDGMVEVAMELKEHFGVE